MTRFSVVTITFNAEKFLARTLESVAIQKGVEFEHIIWDGGSKDRTLDIARSFPHVTIFEGKDEGISDAMNKGAALAAGDFLIHLHADDLFAHPQAMLMFKKTLQLHPHVEWLYGQAHLIDEQENVIQTTPFKPYSFKRLRRYNFITHPAVCVRRSLFECVGGFQSSLRYCMDYDLWLRLASLRPAFAMPSTVACFRKHQLSLSTSEPLGVADEAYRVRNRYVHSMYERFRSYRTWKKRRFKLTPRS